MQDKESLWLVEENANVENLKKHHYFKSLMPGDEWFLVKRDCSLDLYKYNTSVSLKCKVDKNTGMVKTVSELKNEYDTRCPRLFNKSQLDKMTVVMSGNVAK